MRTRFTRVALLALSAAAALSACTNGASPCPSMCEAQGRGGCSGNDDICNENCESNRRLDAEDGCLAEGDDFRDCLGDHACDTVGFCESEFTRLDRCRYP